jgi:D-alanyl-lipoteichoic acid acyltransferase DltB (MBOAT superfamily)
MPFNSTAFLVFFVLVYAVYRLLPHRAQNIFLLLASYFFFGWWDVRFLFLIILSTSLDFICGLMVAEGQVPAKKRLGISFLLILTGFVSLVIPWDKLLRRETDLSMVVNGFLTWNPSWLILTAIVLLIIAFHIFYPRLARLAEKRRRQLFLRASIVGNLAILGFFKYFNFFLENIEAALRGIGLNPGSLHLNIVLPIGISFYTFMTLSYTIDVYKGRMAATKVFHEYALFVAFFPKLLAGPIERAKNFLPQIGSKRAFGADQFVRGFQDIAYGLFKKIVIADGLAASVSSVFAGTYQLTWADAALGTLFFTVQIYCDFSGYSDIATGISSLLGFNLMRNFSFPYFSRNPSEFWNRWHISLSSWFRDYVFFPLGGPYGNTFRWIRNVLVTFLVTGLWHGAAWTFVLWGLYHGMLLVLHRLKESLRKSRKRRKNPLKKAAAIAFFFILTSLGWVLFRARSMTQFLDIVRTLFSDFGNFRFQAKMPTEAAMLGLPLLIVIEFLGNKLRGKRLDETYPLPLWTAAYAAMIFLILIGLSNTPAGFIYFVF